jgi:hypothetical protein
MPDKPQLPASPLAALLQQAATSLPAVSGVTQQHERRFRQAAGEVVLLDTSGSMGAFVGNQRKIDILREALDYALLGGEYLIAFASFPRPIALPDDLPVPAGGTALDLALEMAAARSPRHILVVSDGQPDDEDAALAAAAMLTGTIDVIYCGPDTDHAAIGGGRVVVHDMARASANRQQLGATIRALLPGGTP